MGFSTLHVYAFFSLLSLFGCTRTSHCHGFSCHRAWALGLVGFSNCSSQALETGLRSCGTWAQLPHGVWNLPGPGIKPMSPALVGGFFIIESHICILMASIYCLPCTKHFTNILFHLHATLLPLIKFPYFRRGNWNSEAETLSCYSLGRAAFQPDHIWPQSLCSSPLACVGRTGQPGGAFPTRQSKGWAGTRDRNLVISMGPGSKPNGAIRGGGLYTKWHSERVWRASTESSGEQPQPPLSWTAWNYTRPCTQPWRQPAPQPGTLPDCPQGHCNQPQSPEFHPPSSPPFPVVLCLCCCIMPLRWAHLSDQVDHKYLEVRVHTSIFWLLHSPP